MISSTEPLNEISGRETLTHTTRIRSITNSGSCSTGSSDSSHFMLRFTELGRGSVSTLTP